MSDQARGRRSGGRAGRQAARQASAPVHQPYITRSIKPFEVVSEESLAIIENNADTILEQVGIDFIDYPNALTLLADAGAEIDGHRVRFPRGMCRKIVSENAPAIYTQHARNPERSVQIGGDATVFAPNYGSPFAHDLDRGRRYATLEDFENLVKLAYLAPALHHSGGTVCEPVDTP
ncbi:MAG: trimethylamine methyltransferase family protein, partial [Acidimicrobiia bacterium]|nr:trimethylamine methyltransferase family protein [Acidimicrobiia bacterium]